MSSSTKMGRKQKGRGGKRAKTSTIDDLPPEMLMEILKCIPTSTLISSCGLVNRKWNEISSSYLLRHRPETLLSFFLSSSGSFLLSEKPIEFIGEIEKSMYEMLAEEQHNIEYRTLQELVDCYKSSKNFPCARFSFKDFYKGGDDLKNFKTTIGSKILSIKISPPENQTDVQLLQELLTEHCPDLQELIFDDFCYRYNQKKTKYSGNLKLFNDQDKMTSLPNLKIFRLSDQYKKYLGVVECILKAASTLKEIRGEWEDECSSIKVEDVELLSKFGKLHLVKSTTLKDDKLVGHWKKYPAQIMRFSKIQTEANDININTLIEYSKDTLKELVVLRSGNIVPDVNWSLIPNLQKLSLPANANPRTIFPVGENILLPNLKELEIESTGAPAKKSKQSLVPVPSVRILKLKFDCYSLKYMKDVCIMFPNVTSLDLSSVGDFSVLGEAIWENMKQLMTLCVYIPKNEPDYENDDFDFVELASKEYEFSTELDSCFTGYSEDICIELKEEFDGKTEVSQEELSQYERENPSILDLKYLTTLRLRCGIFQCFSWPFPDIKRQQKEQAQRIKDGISCVSRLFAFQQMSKLRIMIDTEVTESH